jgi:hypothetical protein
MFSGPSAYIGQFDEKEFGRRLEFSKISTVDKEQGENYFPLAW